MFHDHALTFARTALLALVACGAAPLACAEAPPSAVPGPPLSLPLSLPLSAEAFADRVTGRTFYYNSGGQPYGAEQYLPDHRVVWAFTGDDCKRGRWYDKAGYICFAYEGDPGEQCWTFHDGPQGLTAYFMGDQTTEPLIASQSSPGPMACMGPDVGV